MDTIKEIDLSTSDGPKYLSLFEELRARVSDGRLKAGEKMPPVRNLAWDLGVTPGTVARSYQKLVETGVFEAHVGRGTFVADKARPITGVIDAMPQPEIPVERIRDGSAIDLRSPILPDVGQSDLIRSLMRRGADEMPLIQIMDYPQEVDQQELKSLILGNVASFDRSVLSEKDVTLTNGGQHAINLIYQAVLRGDRPVVLTEELAYPGIRHAARLARAQLVSVEQDEQGPVPASILAACRAHHVQLFVTSAHAHNPTTINTTPERRREIAALARAENFQILDDQCYSLTIGDRPSYRDLAPERVWYVSSLAKRVSPALRFGWIISPEGQSEAARIVARHSTFGLAGPIVWLTTEVMKHPQIAEMRAGVVEETRHRVEVARECLAGFDLRSDPLVAFAYLVLPAGWRASSFVMACERAGVLVRSADDFVAFGGRAPNAVRFAFNGGISRIRFREAMSAIADLLHNPPHEMGA